MPETTTRKWTGMQPAGTGWGKEAFPGPAGQRHQALILKQGHKSSVGCPIFGTGRRWKGRIVMTSDRKHALLSSSSAHCFSWVPPSAGWRDQCPDTAGRKCPQEGP